MNLYQSLGYLVLGSRLRRLSESFFAEINRVYQNEGIDFEASWFPVFYLLSKNDNLSIKELSAATEVTHPAASQLITNLKSRGLVATAHCTNDARRQLVQLTGSGRQVLHQVLPVWAAITATMNELVNDDPASAELLAAIAALENSFKAINLSEKIVQKLSTTLNPAMHE